MGLSAERRALFGLAAAAVSGRVPPDLTLALSQGDPLTLAGDAQRLQVHTMIGPVLVRHPELAAAMPDDLALFFRAMHAANRQRLARGLAQFAEIGGALETAGIPAIVLKGGADMLAPLHADPAIRYVGDLDILVPADRADRALAALRDLGAALATLPAREASRFDWRGQRLSTHHLPRLVRPDWAFPVELHVHAGPGAMASVLDPAAMFARRVPAALRGLSVPCADDRACHLLTHATRHKGIVSLRAWIDWSALRRQCDRAAVASRLCLAGYGRAFESSDLMADLLGSADARPLPEGAAPLAHRTLRAFGAAGTLSLAELPRFLFRRCRGLILSSSYRRHIAARLAEGSILRGIAAFRPGPHGPGRETPDKPRRRSEE